ncbi:MAG: plasmid recombination protein [Clostridia bacterium]|nr:plasmid recombination protein [Clostridia bacterium]
MNKRITKLNLSLRKDAVVMNSFVVGADRAFFDGLSKLSQYNFFSDCTNFFEEKYGMENVISAVIHIDETT